MFRNLVLCLCCLFLAACVGREQSSAPPPADFVSTTLGHAAEQAHGELAMIARLRGQGLQPLLQHSDRWLILIAYLTGLSIGVHLLNLLCLPAIVLVYYYKKTPNATAKGSLLALLGSGVLVAAVLYGIVPGIVKVGGWFELLFVNGLGMSFNSGVVVYIILLAAALILRE